MSKRWFPLESNPEVMNRYMKVLGVEGGDIQFCDVYGVDEELLNMVPSPCHAVLFLFPISAKNEAWGKEQIEKIKKEGQEVDNDVYFMNQTIGNACGTVGILHSICNNAEKLKVGGTFLPKLLEETKGMTPMQRAEYLEKDEQIEEAQESAAQEGQTSNQSIQTPIDLHFIAFITKNGSLYELDGRKPFPINCGPSSEATLLKDTANYCRKYMALDPNEVNFTLVAMSSV